MQGQDSRNVKSRQPAGPKAASDVSKIIGRNGDLAQTKGTTRSGKGHGATHRNCAIKASTKKQRADKAQAYNTNSCNKSLAERRCSISKNFLAFGLEGASFLLFLPFPFLFAAGRAKLGLQQKEREREGRVRMKPPLEGRNFQLVNSRTMWHLHRLAPQTAQANITNSLGVMTIFAKAKPQQETATPGTRQIEATEFQKSKKRATS